MVCSFGLAPMPVVRDICGLVVVRASPFCYRDTLIILGDTATIVSPRDLSSGVRVETGEVEECSYDVLASCVFRGQLLQYALKFSFLHRPALGSDLRGTEAIIRREGRLDE